MNFNGKPLSVIAAFETDKVVRYVEQTLTEEEKAQARKNIGADGVSSWNDLTDKPFHEEGGKTYLMEEQTIDGFANDMGYGVPARGVTFGEGMDAFTIVLGETYNVVWGENTYVVVAQDASVVLEGALALGNCSALVPSLSGNNEPFIIAWAEAGVTLLAVDGDESTSHKVAIYQGGEAVWKLNKECLPMDAIDARIEEYISAALEGDY